MKNAKTIVLLLTALAIGGGLWAWWQHQIVYPSTDDATLRANVMTISPQVGGRIAQVLISENDYVRAGDPLVQIDTALLDAALATTQAQYDLAAQSTSAAGSQVVAANARLTGSRANLTQTEIAYDRSAKLLKLGDVSQAVVDQAAADRDQAAANVLAAVAAVSAAQNQAGTAGAGNATLRAALGAMTVAQINLGNARITAPADGWIANINIRPGQIVSQNAPLFSLVEDGAWWVDANFKETDLDRIRPGQPVTLSVDMYAGTALAGIVESIGAGSGAVFSLLPAQNATGNWVKITQRFPVRIKLTAPPDNPALQLRVGASVTAQVDTTAQDAAK